MPFNPFVPSPRKPRFRLGFRIHDLMNVPLVSGNIFVKWSLDHSSLGESSGQTQPVSIKNHRVVWDYVQELEVKMTIDRQKTLVSKNLVLEVIQQIPNSRERLQLGTVKIDVSRYVSVHKDSRRYLLHDSKVNSTLKISIELNQLSGDSNFIAKPLAKDSLFGGIAGLLQDEFIKQDQFQLHSKDNNQSTGVLHESLLRLYRQSFISTWSFDYFISNGSSQEIFKESAPSDPFSLIDLLFSKGSSISKVLQEGLEQEDFNINCNLRDIKTSNDLNVHFKNKADELKNITNAKFLEDQELSFAPRSWSIVSTNIKSN